MAGYLHARESSAQAARRRVSEELKVQPKLRWLDRTAMGDDSVTKFVGVFVGDVAATDPQIQDHSHVERLRWAEIDALKRELSEDDDRFTPALRQSHWSFGDRLAIRFSC